MQHEFSINFGDFKIQQYHGSASDRTWVNGSMHRLAPEQFDALADAFEVTDEIKTLTTDGTHTAPKTFRTTEIDFGGLKLTLFADVPAEDLTTSPV